MLKTVQETEVKEITITRQTRVKHPKGGAVDAYPGDVFTVDENVSKLDAILLIGMKKAVNGKVKVEEPEKPADKDPVEVDNREKDLVAKTTIRAKGKGKSKGKGKK